MSRRDAFPRRGLIWLLALSLIVGIGGPLLAPNLPTAQFADRAYAPPMRIHFFHDGELRAPFVYRQVLVDRVFRTYREDVAAPVTLPWFGGASGSPESDSAVLLLGADPLGRDIFSRLLYGARWSLGVALVGLAGALVLGTLIGAAAGAAGRRVDALLMWGADFVLALPGAYLVLVLRGMLPAVLSPWQIFGLLSLLLALTAWPHVARGVRAVVATERQRDYAEATRAAGGGPWRLAWSLLPAARGFLAVEIVLLLPALLVAEATISFLGLGFPDAAPSWGTLLLDAANVQVLSEAPWMLAPAVAIFLVTLVAQSAGAARSPATF